ncbi:phosphomethylpyrimidine synthase [candidate division KD3-62 bacterium DG_56]|uniref:Phosphomethylpyrimidine synthase n=1 Tax=candidate division KD3-62 bacterium DG_56 TaxID=1704032 RepID=A0A0S7XKG1_9BACT|nr:MAG: phosphomethylpyrimidine synthase [candidate division KD3-62 bacterium DG_56]
MTQLERARAREVTPEMARVAEKENLDSEIIRRGVANGSIVIPANVHHTWLDPIGIGTGLRIKVNANIGTSSAAPEAETELVKLRAALDAKTDTVMDLSTAGTLDDIRAVLLRECPAPFGTVPVYQAGSEVVEARVSLRGMTEDLIFDVIERHARDGVDFITVHCGVTLDIVHTLRQGGRLTDIVSRGGTLLACWMLAHDQENPLYSHFDRLLDIAREHDVTLSLGDGLRPGCLADATDSLQIAELSVLGTLVRRAREAGVQAMVEGPGHVPLDQIEANVLLEKRMCGGAPFYVLGPLVTDVAPGYDHITSAIGGALAGMAGADFLCYVTPSEHLGLPTLEDVREGVMASRIAAHAADVVRLGAKARAWDDDMARARRSLDWEQQFALCIDPERARRLYRRPEGAGEEACTMCGPYCVFKMFQETAGHKLP